MNNDERLVERFFQAFQKLNAKEMNACYSDDVAFYDPIFELLRGDEAKAMWEMLCKNAKDFPNNTPNCSFTYAHNCYMLFFKNYKNMG